ncbi:serine hydrolase [Cohnella sp.]|uniref:serine hydrolase n=1 Tax=Cohnella sp. TaxID=1883426 RepID=UPI00356908E8
MRKTMLLLLSALLLLPAAAFASASAPPPAAVLDKADVEAFAKRFFRQPDVQDQLAGAMLVVVKDGQVLLNEGFGYADLAASTPIDPDRTLFRLASVSKLFTSIGIMQLAEAGKVDLDRDVQTYLPDLAIPNETGFPLTPKHLMTHTTGFDFGDSAAADSPYPLYDFLRDKMPTVVSKPGEVFRYDNFAFSLQGYIIEKISGQPFEDYMADKLFAPLGMANSSFIYDDRVKKALAAPHDALLRPFENSPNVPDNAPKGGMFSTGADMAKFMLAMLAKGQGANGRILTAASVEAMERNSVSIHPDVPGVGYAFESNYPQFYHGRKVVEKGGDLAGFHSNLWLLPEENVGMFLVLNGDKGDLRLPFFAQFMNRYFPATGSGPEFLAPEPTKQQLLRFEGMYRDLRTPAWRYDIAAERGALIVKDAYGTHRLRQTGELLFYDEKGIPAGFKTDDRGNVLFFSYNKSDSWAEKLPEPPRFKDVPADHPYAQSIYDLVQLGAIEGGKEKFHPEEPITRGEFVSQLIRLAGFQPSTQTSSFADMQGSPYAGDIQTALELGVVRGIAGGSFGPDLPLTREQAATFVWRLARAGLGATPVRAELQGTVSSWASDGVQYVVSRQLYGPDVSASEEGPVDYRPKDKMLNQEAAALVYALIMKLL